MRDISLQRTPSFELGPLLWTLSSSYGTATAFSDSATHEPRAHTAFNPERPEALFNRLFQELIKDQECAPSEHTTDSVGGIHFDFSEDVNTSVLDSNFYPLEYDHSLESTRQGTTGDTLQPRTPSPAYQDLFLGFSSPAMSVQSSPSSSTPSESPASTSASPLQPRFPSSYSACTAGKRSVTQPPRNAQIPAHTKPQPARANECRYCHCRFGRRADAARHEKTHFLQEYQYVCLGVPVEEGEYNEADAANGFVHDGKLMVHGCLTTFKDRRDSYRRHLVTRGCPGSKAGYWANVKEVEAARAKRRANGY